MNSKKQSQIDYSKPVAYDSNNRPLYAHPPTTEAKPQTVHMARPVEPERQAISHAVRSKHDQSRMTYPGLNLSEGEFVIRKVVRHPIGLVGPMILGVFLVLAALIFLFSFDATMKSLSLSALMINSSMMILPTLIFVGLVLIGMYIIYYVYSNNEFYLTNESVIQEIQISLFSKSEQTVSLVNIEDASYTQLGIIQQIFNYGSIRLSTEGEETTYRFTYVSNPKEVIAVLNNAVEAFKNGRPVVND